VAAVPDPTVVAPDAAAEPVGGQPAPAPYKIRLASPDLGIDEVEAVQRVFASGVLTGGPMTREFERAFAERHQVEHAVAFANGTVGLVAMFTALEIGPGDEVVTPSLTFVSSATSIVHVGATPVFAEVDPETLTLDPADAARRITPRTRAILAVHYGGQPADMAELRELADEAGVLLLEDAAQAHGASYRGRPAGGLGAAAMFSFTPTKNITTGEGGIVTTGRADLAARLRLLRNHGATAPDRHEVLGWNWRITEMQAAMGVEQLRKLDAILARKRANADWMAKRLGHVPGLRLPVARPDREHVYMLYTLVADGDRDHVVESLASEGIESKVYFPPVHRQPLFAATGCRLPVTEALARRIVSIPFHSRLSAGELEEIAQVLERAVR
jgi:perosamine synthetase